MSIYNSEVSKEHNKTIFPLTKLKVEIPKVIQTLLQPLGGIASSLGMIKPKD